MPRRSDLYQRWAQEIRRHAHFHPGQRVGAAVSGGPDSILLLHFMRLYAQEAALTLAVVHFNHKLRGEESDADENFVREQTQHLGLELFRGEPQTSAESRPGPRNLEAAARELRYRFFFSLLNRGALDKIVTGHNADDQAETVLLRLLRGSGTRGLGGIYPALGGGKILRPFLGLTRNEIERELQERKLAFRTDSTNRDVRFQRNKVRHELLPLLKREFNPEVAHLLASLSQRARDDEAVLEQWAHERALPWRVRDENLEKIPVRALVEFPPALQRRVLRQMIQAVKGDARGISQCHLESLRQLALAAQSGRKIIIPGHLEARREFDWLIVAPEPTLVSKRELRVPVQIPGEVTVPELGVAFEFKLIEAQAEGKTYNKGWTEGLDPNRLQGKLTLRSWKPGDRFQPLGSQKVRKLKELFGRRRIPAGQRKGWPVLECGTEVVWVRGFPVSSLVAAAPGSEQVIVIQEKSVPAR